MTGYCLPLGEEPGIERSGVLLYQTDHAVFPCRKGIYSEIVARDPFLRQKGGPVLDVKYLIHGLKSSIQREYSVSKKCGKIKMVWQIFQNSGSIISVKRCQYHSYGLLGYCSL